MDTIILAGGYAKRMTPTTNEVPKHLLPVAGRPMLNYALDSLEKLYSRTSGVCYLSVNKKFETDFRNFINDSKTKIHLELIVEDTASEDKKLGSIGALKQIFDQIKMDRDSSIFVIGGDNIFSLNLIDMQSYHHKNSLRSLVALYDLKNTELAKKYGVVQLGECHGYGFEEWGKKSWGNRIAKFIEKPNNPPSTLVSTAIYIFKAADLSRIEEYIFEGHNPDTIGRYLSWIVDHDIAGPDKGYDPAVIATSGLNGFVFDGYWFDIGSHESLEEANRFFRK